MENVEFDRREFLKRIVINFMNKQSSERLQSAYNGFMSLIDRDLDPMHKGQNDEKKRILETCYNIFRNPSFRERLAESQKSMDRQELLQKLIDAVEEKGLGYQKRKYDMSDLYAGNQITPKTERFIPLPANSKKYHRPTATFDDNLGNTITVEQTGQLVYSTLSVSNESVKSYRYTKTNNGSTIQDFPMLFSNIDINLLNENKDYRNAVLGELFSKNNLKLSNAGGYIGEIIVPQTPLSVGAQRQDESKFYRYQISPKYALEFDPQNLSAAVNYSRQQANQKQVDSDDDIEH